MQWKNHDSIYKFYSDVWWNKVVVVNVMVVIMDNDNKGYVSWHSRVLVEWLRAVFTEYRYMADKSTKLGR